MEPSHPAPLVQLSESFDKTLVKKEVVPLSSLHLNHPSTSKSPAAFILHNCLTKDEADSLIALGETEGFSPALVNVGGSDVLNEGARSGSRYIYDDEALVCELWRRIKDHLPVSLKGAKVVGLNERLRFLKYTPGQKFQPHYDGTYSRPDNPLEVSLMTLQIYLNEGFGGGETTFLGDDHDDEGQAETRKSIPIVPTTGMILAFEQDLMHEGSELISGVKYTVRTDVMYKYS